MFDDDALIWRCKVIALTFQRCALPLRYAIHKRDPHYWYRVVKGKMFCALSSLWSIAATSFGRHPRERTYTQAHPGFDCHSLEGCCERGDSSQRLLDKLFGDVARWEQFLIGRTPHTDPEALHSEKNAKAIARQTKKARECRCQGNMSAARTGATARVRPTDC